MSYDQERKMLMALGILGVCAVFAMPIGCVALNGYEYSNGSRTAPLLKVSRKGMIWKTWEGQLAIFETVHEGALQPFEFTIEDPKLAEQLVQAEGKTVRIHYTQGATAVPWRGSTSTYVTSFEVIQ